MWGSRSRLFGQAFLILSSKFQGSKETQGTQFSVLLAAPHEHPAVASVPEEVRVAVVAVEPATIVVVFDAEHVEVRARVADRLHDDEEPLASGLVLVLQAQLGTHLCGTELEAERESPLVDVLSRGTLFEAEVSDRDIDKVERHLDIARRKGGLAENVVAPGADATTLGFQSPAEVIGGLETRAELDALPDMELEGGLGRTETREELLKSSRVVDPALHQISGHVGKILCDSRNQLSSLSIHGVFSFWFSPVVCARGLPPWQS